MTDFEQELIKAIDYGCPRCGYVDLIATCTEEHSYDLYSLGKDGVDYEEDNDLIGPLAIIKVWCHECGDAFPLWTIETGWIPELQKVMRGE